MKRKIKRYLDKMEDSVKRTALWEKMRPRSICLYGIGAPRTGTLSVARAFKNQYRSEHEPNYPKLIPLIEKKMCKKEYQKDEIEKLINRKRLEVYSSHILVYFLEEIVELEEEPKFLVTYRDIEKWLRSMLDRICKIRPKKFEKRHPGKWWSLWRKKSFGDPFPLDKSYITEKGVNDVERVIEGLMEYYVWHYKRVEKKLKDRNVLYVKTEELSSSEKKISKFLEIDEEIKIEKHHSSKEYIHDIDRIKEGVENVLGHKDIECVNIFN